MSTEPLQAIIESALFAAGRPLSIKELGNLFVDEGRPEPAEIAAALSALATLYETRTLALKEVASGFYFQVRAQYSTWVNRLWQEKPTRYSRALLETLAIIAYRQPITRGEIEAIRGVSVSTHTIKTLTEHGWLRGVGHRDAPGKPVLYATTAAFLDHFNMSSLQQLPPLAELRDLREIEAEGAAALAKVADCASIAEAGTDDCAPAADDCASAADVPLAADA